MESAHKTFEHMITGDEFEDYRFKWRTGEGFRSISEASTFFIEVMLQQGQKADRVPDAAKHFVKEYFPDDSIWHDIAKKHIDSLTKICQQGYNGRSYASKFNVNKFPKWLKDNAQIMIETYDGDPRNIWDVSKEDVEKIYTRFEEFSGIGDALAKMAQFTLVRRYEIAGGIKSKQYLKVKPDVHVCRVLHRMGLSDSESPEDAIKCVESAKISSQADLDAVLVNIGRKHCFKNKPMCPNCLLKKVCKKIDVCL